VDVQFCKFEAVEAIEKQFRFAAADFWAVNCIDLIYDVIWSCFERYLPMTSSHSARKFLWVTKEINGLQIRTMRLAKKINESER
jgi:hypothetical protein